MPIGAQISERVFQKDYRIDPGKKGELSVELDNISFFKDNEYTGKLMKGYSLPGLWLQPKAVFYPLENIKLELGLNALCYWGANKYPNYAYQDIAAWRGHDYQKGMHFLPYFRAHIALSNHVDLVLGDIYGGANHRLIEPLYCPELNLTADPEAGLQLLYNSRAFDLDAWVNWESFIFNNDTHQEAFTVGLSTRVKFNSPDSRFHVYLPVQALVQHRGGEIDTIYTNSVQTLMNAAAGVGVIWNTGHPVFKNVNVELDATGYYQQAGKLWPFDDGAGGYLRASADISDFRVKASYWKCKDFISMFGSPFYGAVSTIDGATFDGTDMVYFGLEYSRRFGKGYAVGIDMDVYNHFSMVADYPDKPSENIASALSFSVGVYFRINPSFLIKKF
ncbi:MAG: hypothetical protein RR382_09095 [Tannerellaceae bacterium]